LLLRIKIARVKNMYNKIGGCLLIIKCEYVEGIKGADDDDVDDVVVTLQ